MDRQQLLKISGYCAAIGGGLLVVLGLVDGAGWVDVIAGICFVFCGLGVAVGLFEKRTPK